MDAVAPGLDWTATLWWCGVTSILALVMTAVEFLIRRRARYFMRGGESRFALALGLRSLFKTLLIWPAPLALDLATERSIAFPALVIGVIVYWVGAPLLIGILWPQSRRLSDDYWAARQKAWRLSRDWKRPNPLNLSAG